MAYFHMYYTRNIKFRKWNIIWRFSCIVYFGFYLVLFRERFHCYSLGALKLFGACDLLNTSNLRYCLKYALQYFLKTGTCKYGSTCKYHHPKDRRGAAPVSFNTLGLPMRQVCASLYTCSFIFSKQITVSVDGRYGSSCFFLTSFPMLLLGRKTMSLLHENRVL